ncbi:peptidylglycine monooxygenase [Pseudoscourfieldia marina]
MPLPLPMLRLLVLVVVVVVVCPSASPVFVGAATSSVSGSESDSSSGSGSEFSVSMYMPGVTTQQTDSYMCLAVKVPKTGYITAYEPKAKQEVVHHMLLHGCREPYLPKENTPWPCVMGQICGRGQSGAVQFLYGWGKNAPPLKLPEGVGFSMGAHDANTGESTDGVEWLVLQVHYLVVADKPDFSGVRIMATTQSQPLKAGVLAFATGGSIPPKKEAFHVISDACYDDARPVQVFAFRVHAHGLGQLNTLSRVAVASVDNRVDLDTAVHDLREEPNQLVGRSPQLPQSFEPLGGALGEKFLLTPGTRLRMICTYNSMSRDKITYFGFSASHEMCNVYLMVMATEGVSHGNFDHKIGSALPALSATHAPAVPWKDGLVGPDANLPDNLGQVSAVVVGWNAHVFVLVRRDIAWGSFGVRQGDRVVGQRPMAVPEQQVSGASLFSFRAATTSGAKAEADPAESARGGLLDGMLHMPHGLSLTPDGHHFWITDVAQHVAMKVTRTGEVEAVIGEKGTSGQGDKLCMPTHAIGASDGSVYIADGYCNCRVAHFGKDGSLLAQWPPKSGQGLRLGQQCPFQVPHGIAVDECASLIAVADRENARVVWLRLVGDDFAPVPEGELPLRGMSAESAGIRKEVQGYPYAIRRVGGGDFFVLTWDRGGSGNVAVHRVSAPPKHGNGARRIRLSNAESEESAETRRASVISSWSLPGVDAPHDLAVVASHDGGAIVYVAETRGSDSRLRRFELSPSSSTTMGGVSRAGDVSLEQDRSALASRRAAFAKISHGVG